MYADGGLVAARIASSHIEVTVICMRHVVLLGQFICNYFLSNFKIHIMTIQSISSKTESKLTRACSIVIPSRNKRIISRQVVLLFSQPSLYSMLILLLSSFTQKNQLSVISTDSVLRLHPRNASISSHRKMTVPNVLKLTSREDILSLHFPRKYNYAMFRFASCCLIYFTTSLDN